MMVPAQVKRHPVFAVILIWILVTTPLGMTAEAAFDLNDHRTAPAEEGLNFLPETTGLRTYHPHGERPLRASGTVRKPSVRIVEPRPVGRCGGALPDCSIMMCESRGNIRAENRHSSASGKWQFVDGTWNGYGGYQHASDAPEDVQDAKAREVWANGAGRGHWRQCL